MAPRAPARPPGCGPSQSDRPPWLSTVVTHTFGRATYGSVAAVNPARGAASGAGGRNCVPVVVCHRSAASAAVAAGFSGLGEGLLGLGFLRLGYG